MTSQCGTNKNVSHETELNGSPMFLPRYVYINNNNNNDNDSDNNDNDNNNNNNNNNNKIYIFELPCNILFICIQ